jgi:hypothetical protein
VSDDARSILAGIPDWRDWSAAERWLTATVVVARTMDPAEGSVAEPIFTSVGLSDLALARPPSLFGLYPSPDMQRFLLGIFAADLGCYLPKVDQVSFQRLVYVVHSYPEGFRLWFGRAATEGWVPVGYSGWYPISTASFEIIEQRPDALRDRMIVPAAEPQPRFAYVFNYSLTAPWRQARFSRQLLGALDGALKRHALEGLATITVSEDGARVARRFGMQRTGALVVDGSEEDAWAGRAAIVRADVP